MLIDMYVIIYNGGKFKQMTTMVVFSIPAKSRWMWE